MKETDFIQSVLKACRLLDCLAEGKTSCGLMELSRAADLNKSTARRLLCTLESAGYVKQTDSGEGYSLGVGAVRLGLFAMEGFDMKNVALPYLKELVEHTGETANLAVLDGDQMIYIASIDSPKVMRAHTILGKAVDMHTSAIGKILLAGMTDEEIIAIAQKSGLTRRTDKTITSVERLLTEIRRVREEACAYDMEEDDEEMICVASKVLDRKGKTMAGVSISGAKTRMTDRLEEYRDAVKSAAYGISSDLGYIGPVF